MAKMSEVDRVVAEMEAERSMIVKCALLVREFEGAANLLDREAAVLAQCIARLTNGSGELPAPKPTRTRKSRKATEPTL